MAKRILILEDNPLNRQLMRDVLEYRGHEISEAATLVEARTLLEGPRPDLVLADIGVPGGGGEALLASIRSDATLAAMPVVAVTAFAMSGDRERFLAMGFDRYLSKPIDVRTFATEIETLLSAERTGGRLDDTPHPDRR